MSKNVVHSLEPGETPSNSASHQPPTLCNVLKYRKILLNGALRLRFGCGYFFNLLKTSTVLHHNRPDDSYKWSNIGFGEEIKQAVSIEVHFTHFIWSS